MNARSRADLNGQGMLQISGPELCIVETKPDTVPSDLRLSTAWPELLSLADEVDLEGCDDILHKHTPWGATALLYAPECLSAIRYPLKHFNVWSSGCITKTYT